MGRRGSDLEQAHREQKGHTKLHRQTGTTHSLNASHFQALLAQLTNVSFPYHSSQHWASQLLTQQVPCLFSLQSTSVTSSQARLVLPPSCATAPTKTISPSSIPQTGFSTTRKVPAQEGSCSPASPPSNLTITAISTWLIYRLVQWVVSHDVHLTFLIQASFPPISHCQEAPRDPPGQLQDSILKGQTAQAGHKQHNLHLHPKLVIAKDQSSSIHPKYK